MDSDPIYLQCIKSESKLRVRIISPGYHRDANVQFPRDIRVEGRKYSVPRSAISFSEGPRRKFFYRVSKQYIQIVSAQVSATISHIFEDETVTECIICMSAEKDSLFAPCGHYSTCYSCADKITQTTAKCPICRSRITEVVKRENVQN